MIMLVLDSGLNVLQVYNGGAYFLKLLGSRKRRLHRHHGRISATCAHSFKIVI